MTGQRPLWQRFWEKVDRSGDCWTWTAARTSSGYGVINVGGRAMRAHRLAHELAVGPIGDRSVLHSCDNPACVNPEHLRLGTQAENMADMARRRRSGRYTRPDRTPRGERAGLAKLTRARVSEIRRRYPSETQTALAREFGVHQGTISAVIRGRTWA